MMLRVPVDQIQLRLTLGIDGLGNLCRQTLQDMSASDIILARTYYDDEAARLALKAHGTRDDQTRSLFLSASEGYAKLALMLDGVWTVLMPRWRGQPDVTLASAILRWWPDDQEIPW